MRATLGLVLLVGCGPMVSELELTHDPDHPGVVWASWTSRKAGVGVVEFGGSTFDQRSPAGPEGTEHRIQLRGLDFGQSYELRGVTTVGSKEHETDPVTHAVPPGRADVPLLERRVWEPDLACEGDGYILGSVLNFLAGGSAYVVIWDREGNPVWAHPSDGEWLPRVRPSRAGDGLLWLHNDATRMEDFGKITHMAYDGTVVSETRALWAHHDFVEHADGTLAWLGYEFSDGYPLPDPDADALGLVSDIIYEAAPGSAEGAETAVWSLVNDYPHELYVPEATDLDLGFIEDYWEFSHGNSLMLSEDGTRYGGMFRWIDAFMMIDRATGGLEWQFGGLHNDLSGNPDDLFSHAHMSEMWDGGMLMFDNADNTGAHSGVAEYAIDEVAGTYEKTWDYRYPEAYREIIMGDAVRMEGCDNRLVAWPQQSRIQEITPDGQVAMALYQPDGWLIARITYLPDLYDTGY